MCPSFRFSFQGTPLLFVLHFRNGFLFFLYIESKNKALVLEAFDTLFISVTTKQLNVIGRLTTFSIALISRLVAMACSISLRTFHRRLGMNQERLWPKGTLSSCMDGSWGLAFP
jgi:hypothetical protein